MTGITDEMIDTAARAHAAHEGYDWTEVSEFWQRRYLGMARIILESALDGRAVVDLPQPIAFQDEHSEVKAWEPDGVDFQVNLHPSDWEKDAEVSFAYWQISPQHARGVGAAFLAAAEHHDRQNSGAAGGVL